MMPDSPVRKVTIFFGSPTDVMPERDRAARVVDRLQSRFREYVTIQMGANRQIVIDIDVSGSPQAEGRSQSG
jgi:hypothetical protein